MAVVSKSKRKANPNLTKTGKVRLHTLSADKLKSAMDKARPRDKDKMQRLIKARESNQRSAS